MEFSKWPAEQSVNEDVVKQVIRESGLDAMRWEGEPHQSWTPHLHGKDKTLWCAVGSIVFHLGRQDVPMQPGDKMMLPAGTVHAADAGSEGVVCYESPPTHENTKFEQKLD